MQTLVIHAQKNPGLELSGKHFLWLEAVVWKFFAQTYVVHDGQNPPKHYSVSLIPDQLKVPWRREKHKGLQEVFIYNCNHEKENLDGDWSKSCYV